jgi:hypothetical protein
VTGHVCAWVQWVVGGGCNARTKPGVDCLKRAFASSEPPRIGSSGASSEYSLVSLGQQWAVSNEPWSAVGCLKRALASSGLSQTSLGQQWAVPNEPWPAVGCLKRALASSGLSQTSLGQQWLSSCGHVGMGVCASERPHVGNAEKHHLIRVHIGHSHVLD